MNNITRVTTIGLPAAIGLGLAWVGVQIMKNEKGLQQEIWNYDFNSMQRQLRVYK